MTAEQLITAYRQGTSDLASVANYYNFEPVMQDGEPEDANAEYRNQVVEILLHDFSIKDIQLIRSLITEEISADHVLHQHENLYQLCFYLFELGQLEDTFILYDAKFNARNMDAGAMLDRELMTVGHEITEVIEYVEAVFAKDAALKEKYAGIIEELHGLINYPDYSSIQDYSKYLKGYFFGHEDE